MIGKDDELKAGARCRGRNDVHGTAAVGPACVDVNRTAHYRRDLRRDAKALRSRRQQQRNNRDDAANQQKPAPAGHAITTERYACLDTYGHSWHMRSHAVMAHTRTRRHARGWNLSYTARNRCSST